MTSRAVAHEYWLDPVTPVVMVGGKAVLDIVNGENFTGPAFPYNPERIKSIQITGEKDNRAYVGRLGDYPAIQTTFTSEGIHGIAVETTPLKLTYKSRNKFNAFLDYHDLKGVLKEQINPEQDSSSIVENYIRSAKTYLQVTTVQSQLSPDISDTKLKNLVAFEPIGHVFEMILLESPFGVKEKLSIKLRYQGKPLAARQVELFWSGDKSNRQTAITDNEGIATINLFGDGDYLLNAVHIKSSDSSDADWESFWASITFKRLPTQSASD